MSRWRLLLWLVFPALRRRYHRKLQARIWMLEEALWPSPQRLPLADEPQAALAWATPNEFRLSGHAEWLSGHTPAYAEWLKEKYRCGEIPEAAYNRLVQVACERGRHPLPTEPDPDLISYL